MRKFPSSKKKNVCKEARDQYATSNFDVDVEVSVDVIILEISRTLGTTVGSIGLHGTNQGCWGCIGATIFWWYGR